MAEKEAGGTSRRDAGRWRAWAAVAVLAGVIPTFGGWLWYSRGRSASAWEQLVAINRAHLLDPNENAATVYDMLTVTPSWWPRVLGPLTPYENVTSGFSGFALPDANEIPDDIARRVISLVQEAARYDRCYFSLTDSNRRQNRLFVIQHAAEITAGAARADLPAGRTAAAREKWQAVLCTARHLRQQLMLRDLMVAAGTEMFVWHKAGDFIVREDATEEQLRMIESLVPALTDRWNQEAAPALRVQRLFARLADEETTLLGRLAELWRGTRSAFPHDDIVPRTQYLRLLADRRGTRLLVALRRYRNATGAWPQRLDDVRADVPKEAWQDPFHRRLPFLYRATAEGFLLYCRGSDGLDQSGQGDDWRIWPRGKATFEKPHRQTSLTVPPDPERS